MVQIVDPALNTITAVYDNFGRKTSLSDPDRGTSTYSWDGLGRLRTTTDAKAITSAYVYDDAGHKINRYVNDFLDGTWTYNGPTGLLTSVSGGDGFVRSYATDSFGRPITVSTQVPSDEWAARDFTEHYSYDGIYGRMKGIEYPSGETIRLDYDGARGLPIGETQMDAFGNAGTVYRKVTGISPRGMPTFTTLGNQLVDLAAYDESTGMAKSIYTGQVLSTSAPTTQLAQCAQAQSNAFVRCLDFKYDQFSNLDRQTKYLWSGTAGVQQPNVVETYQYDDLQRLLAESRSFSGITPNGSSLSESYTYDDTGNITSKSDFGSTYNYGGAGRPSGAGPHAVLSVTNPAGSSLPSWNYQYDVNGNMTGDGQRSLNYDNQDRPESIAMAGVLTAFRYTPDGDRYVQRTINPGNPSINRTIYYVDKVYERVDWDHNVAEERTYLGKTAVIENKAGSAREVRYLHVDRLGSSDAATDVNGAEILTDAHGYDAYGRPRGRDWQPSSSQMHPNGEFGATTNHGFTGQEQLDETLLTHMNGRIYDYRLGRFLGVDPIIGNPADSQSINPYTYVGNNPLSGIDPTGYSEVSQKSEEPFVENHRNCFAECRNSNPSIGADTAPTKNGAAEGTSGGSQNAAPNTSTINADTPGDIGSKVSDDTLTMSRAGGGSPSTSSGTSGASGGSRGMSPDTGNLVFLNEDLSPAGEEAIQTYRDARTYLTTPRDSSGAAREAAESASSLISGVEQRGAIIIFNSRQVDDTTKSQSGLDVISWDPKSALQLTTMAVNGNKTGGDNLLSPAMSLFHEFGHASLSYQEAVNLANVSSGKYSQMNDMYVISALERPLARALGEGVRYDHGGAAVRVQSVTDHTSDRIVK